MDLRIRASLKYSFNHSIENLDEIITEAKARLGRDQIPDKRALEHLAAFVNRNGISDRDRSVTARTKEAMDILKKSAPHDPVEVGKIITSELKNTGIHDDSYWREIPAEFFGMAVNLPKLMQCQVSFLLAKREDRLDKLDPAVFYAVIMGNDYDQPGYSMGQQAIGFLVDGLFSKETHQSSAFVLNEVLGKCVRKVTIEKNELFNSDLADVTPSSLHGRTIYLKILESMYNHKHDFDNTSLKQKLGWHDAKFALGQMIASSLPKNMKLKEVLKPLTTDNPVTRSTVEWIYENRRPHDQPSLDTSERKYSLTKSGSDHSNSSSMFGWGKHPEVTGTELGNSLSEDQILID